MRSQRGFPSSAPPREGTREPPGHLCPSRWDLMPGQSNQWHLIPLMVSSDSTLWVIPLLGLLRDLFHPKAVLAGWEPGLSTWITPQLFQCFRATETPPGAGQPGMAPPGVPLSQSCSKKEPKFPQNDIYRCPSRPGLLQGASWSSQDAISRCPSEPSTLQRSILELPRWHLQVSL